MKLFCVNLKTFPFFYVGTHLLLILNKTSYLARCYSQRGCYDLVRIHRGKEGHIEKDVWLSLQTSGLMLFTQKINSILETFKLN